MKDEYIIAVQQCYLTELQRVVRTQQGDMNWAIRMSIRLGLCETDLVIDGPCEIPKLYPGETIRVAEYVNSIKEKYFFE